jgi:hypothetical protein
LNAVSALHFDPMNLNDNVLCELFSASHKLRVVEDGSEK